MKLTAAERAKLSASDFAVPGKRELPINDATHVKLAWRLLPLTKDLTTKEIVEARRRIIARAKQLKIDTSGWNIPKTSKEDFGVEEIFSMESFHEQLTPLQYSIRTALCGK